MSKAMHRQARPAVYTAQSEESKNLPYKLPTIIQPVDQELGTNLYPAVRLASDP